MKKVLSTLVIFSSLLLIGCNNNSTSDPVSPQLSKVNDHPDNNVIYGKIPLDIVLVLPGPGNEYLQLNGSIGYTEEVFKNNIIKFTSVESASKYDVKLDISIGATLSKTDMPEHNNQTWNIASESKNLLYVSEEGFYVLVKSYTVRGRKDDLKLVCRFFVTTDGVGLNSVELKERL